MAIAHTPIVERISRVLAALDLSGNADGTFVSASADVDDAWPDYKNHAVAVLRAMREPDPAMVEVGDLAIWEKMIASALGKTLPSDEVGSSYEVPEPGTDPMHEGP
jgi:hypothetical protein